MRDLVDLLRLGGTALDWQQALGAVLLAYALCHLIAWVYTRTYRGLSYSRSFVQSLVVSGVVAAMLMLAIGESLARGIGIVGTLALIRFRTNLRDPLDMVFVLAGFGAGIGCGTGSFIPSVAGTFVFLAVVALVRLTSFGSLRQHDGVVRLRLAKGADEGALEKALVATCHRFALVTLRDVAQGDEVERAYHVTLKDDVDEGALVEAIVALGAHGVVLSLEEANVEL